MNQLWLFLSFLFPLIIFWIPRRMKERGLRSFLLRRTLVVLPYLLWLIVLDHQKTQRNFVGIILLFLMVGLLLWWERKEYLFKISACHARLAGSLSKVDFLASLYNLIVFVVAEEVFFRLGVLSVFPTKLAVTIQAVAFVAAHYLTPWGRSLTWKDLTRQFVFALTAGFYFIATNDLILCILGHALLNMPELIHLVRRVTMKSSVGETLYGSF